MRWCIDKETTISQIRFSKNQNTLYLFYMPETPTLHQETFEPARKSDPKTDRRDFYLALTTPEGAVKLLTSQIEIDMTGDLVVFCPTSQTLNTLKPEILYAKI